MPQTNPPTTHATPAAPQRRGGSSLAGSSVKPEAAVIGRFTLYFIRGAFAQNTPIEGPAVAR
eukprot:scaffold89983_cov54-Phaeocystis_antarctica.AAC.2